MQDIALLPRGHVGSHVFQAGRLRPLNCLYIYDILIQPKLLNIRAMHLPQNFWRVLYYKYR